MNDQGFSTAVITYCYRGHEISCAAKINEQTNVRAIVPMRIRRDKEKGGWVDKKIKLLPSYMFLYANGENALSDILSALRTYKTRLVTYGDGTAALRGADLEFARWIWNNDGLIGTSSAVREGDSIRIVEGALRENRGIIRKIDRRHKLAQIELEINGLTLWLSYDWVDRL